MAAGRSENVFRNLIWGYVYKVLSIVLPFAFRTVLIYYLGNEYVGINSLFTSVLKVLSLTELGFGSAMVYSMYEPIAQGDTDKLQKLLNYYKVVYRVLGCVILVVGMLILPFVPRLAAGAYPSEINLYIVYVMYLLNTVLSYLLFAYRGAILTAHQRNDIESKILLGFTLFRYGSEIACICVTKQYYLVLLMEVLSTVLCNILKYLIASRKYPQILPCGKLDSVTKKEIKENVKALAFHKVGGVVLNSVDNIVISSVKGLVILATYSNYYYIISAISSIISTCFGGITASVGNSFVTESIEKNKVTFKRLLFFNAWIVGWCTVCLICLYHDFMLLWVGKEGVFPDYYSLMFSIYFFVHSIRRTIIVFRDGAGMWQDNKWQPIVSALFNLCTNIILIYSIGIVGVILSSIFSMVLVDVPWEATKFCKRINMRVKEYFCLLIYYFVISCSVALITFGVVSFIDFQPFVNLLLKGSICVFIPNVLFWWFYRKKEEFEFFIVLMKKVIRKIISH